MDDLTRLALSARSGDRDALARFVRVSQGDVWRWCAHLVGPADADDVTQDAFIRAIASLPSFRAESGARTWLFAIARRTCADAIRRNERQRRLLGRLGGAPAAPAPPGERSELDDLLARLDEDRRMAFVATQVLGLSYDEAAEVCGCPVGTIRSRVARARVELAGWWQGGQEAASS